jgi:hypothetical protein
MSPLAAAVYDILRLQPGLPDARITYAQLAARLRDTSEDFEHITHRSQQLYAALCEVGEACRRLRLPSLAALVVRADSGRPGAAYFEGRNPPLRYRGEQRVAWQQDLEAAIQAVYPPRAGCR